MHLQLFLEHQNKQNGAQTHWDQRVENQQYIGQTPHTYVHIDMNLNFMHTLANL